MNGGTARRLTTPRLWPGRALLAAALGLAAVSVIQLVLAAVHLLPSALLWLTPVPAMVVAGIASWAAARAVGSAAIGRFWRQVAVGIWLAGLGTLARTVRVFAGGDPDLQGPDTVIYIVAMAVVAWALCRLPLGLRNRSQRWAFSMDICAVLIAAGLFCWQLSIRSALAQQDPDRYALLGALGSLAFTLVVVFALAKVGLTRAAAIDPKALRLLGLSLVIGALGSLPEPVLAARSELTATPLVVALSALVATLAALRQARAGASTTTVDDSGRRRPFSLLPYLAVAATDALLLVSTGFADHGARIVVALSAVLLAALVVGRQITSFRENSRLLARLDASMVEVTRHERRFRSVVQNSSDLITIADADGILTYVSPSAERLLGAPAEAWVGKGLADLVHAEDLPRVRAHHRRMVGNRGRAVVLKVRLLRADGSSFWAEVTSANLLQDAGVSGVVSNCRDITDAREFQQKLHHQASHDALTGLANRALFGERLEHALRWAGPRTVSVALIDLNDFKPVNDTLGHHAGDQLLVAAADRLRASVSSSDVVARLGGDEFAILLADGEEMDAVVERVVAAFAAPVRLAGSDLPLSASIGVASATAGISSDELRRRADIAMYAAKADRTGPTTRHLSYTAEMDAPLARRMRLEYDLSDAFATGRLRLMYQPIVLLDGERLVGLEALVRWDHPEFGTVLPAQFIPIAEGNGLIVPLGRWVLREACRKAAAWHERYGTAAPALSVNVSARELREGDYADTVIATLAETGLAPERLTIEITESAALGAGGSLTGLEQLRALGVRVALDDFGTGQSSLSVLQACPVDELKLDRSFTDECTERQGVCIAVIEIGRALGLDVVAEGIESPEQAELLRQLGYTRVQGYQYGSPMDAEAAGRRIAEGATVAAARVAIGSTAAVAPQAGDHRASRALLVRD
jgi:diguanylate cyclase (GGDEF)-like protein/PAS domain S-box-containing protein